MTAEGVLGVTGTGKPRLGEAGCTLLPGGTTSVTEKLLKKSTLATNKDYNNSN